MTGCGGNPVFDPTPGAGTGGTGATNAGGSGGITIVMGGENGMGEGGSGELPVDYVCGNQQLEPTEFCDDGNTADDDGCSGDCADVDLDYDCSVVGMPCKRVVICGNGKLEGAELCDDKNVVGGDGCSADCSTIEEGWACVRPSLPCVGIPVCGNAERERGEECDDGQAPMSGDGCDEQCQIEVNDGYYCPIVGQLCVKQVCGDGVRTPSEACDDGQTPPLSGDGCSNACGIEEGFRCNMEGCLPICGDGLVKPGEECDDGDRDSSDGCSAACTEEPFFNCSGQPSTCISSIACGNSMIEPGEICDPPGVNGCSAGCKSFNPDTSDPPDCGNDVIEEGETCDPPNGNMGCSATCAVQNGWTCPQAGVCFRNPYCGDSIVQTGEQCDPPQVGAGCTAGCQEENGWDCFGFGPSVCVNPTCGNGVVEPGEQCDDGTATAAADGCNNTCTIGAGWACPNAGVPCIPRCGDGTKLMSEQCDDGDTMSGDGCNGGCKIEPGFKCPTPNMSCVVAVCGDNVVDSGEGCDTGGTCIGGSNPGTACSQQSTCTGGGQCRTVAGDGCGATCQPEPPVTVGTNPTVAVDCGDGLITGSEECDDGNDDAGDGCSDTCVVEPGWDCPEDVDLPSSLEMRVTYRDFKANGASSGGGHPHFQNVNQDNKGIAGPPCTTGNQGTCGRLDNQGKPATVGGFSSIPGGAAPSTSSARFATWYRDTNTLGFDVSAVQDSLPLTQVGGATSDVYEYSSAAHFPLDGRGLGNTCSEVSPSCCNAGGACVGHNYNFTTELRYFFQYQGGETLTFRGDDDVWVFINGRLAVDVGGVHCAQVGRVILGDENASCSLHGTDYNGDCATTGDPPACGLSMTEQTDDTDGRFGLTKGGVYEIVLFHAERHTTASNFRLTLAGFLAPRSFCNPMCGDGIVAGDEACDDGGLNSDTIAGRCNTTCTARAYCGDGVRQVGEACDNGTNTTQYDDGTAPANACAPGCKLPANCGDGLLQAGQGTPGEVCDNGAQNDDASYGPTSCTTSCQLGGYCGDMTVNGNEACDLGSMNGKTYGANSCGYNCQPGPRCGDDIRNGSEQCDDGADNGTATSSCTSGCILKDYCGDGVKNGTEQCDYGQFASNNYGGCTDMCLNGPSCGDGVPNPPFEECDEGTANNTGGYLGCTSKCDLGPRCGDGLTQAANGEACDNGFNDDDYKYDDMSCGDQCTPPPYCGDAEVQPNHELCDLGTGVNDDDTYEGCTTECEFGPFCGDGTVDPEEACDKGLDNVSYEPAEGGCSYDCQPAPFCGDNVRNGPEQCDMGAAQNTGDYGTCNPDCTFAPRCGDKVRQGTEECDEGPSGSLKCTPTCKRRVVVQ
ncbi:MAG TPA: DUF4215 domain-containing protein [Polyangiaceae bacterium]|nr:DUF4215 domain-containing protein [Polyangiaceae bacterium]